jgi:hypothetical protein
MASFPFIYLEIIQTIPLFYLARTSVNAQNVAQRDGKRMMWAGSRRDAACL